MTRGSLLALIGAVAGVVGAAVWLLQPTADTEPTTQPGPATHATVTREMPAARGTAPTSVNSPHTRAVSAAIHQAFRDAPLDDASAARLADGNVAGVAHALAATDDAVAAVQLAELETLCASLAGGRGADDSRAALAAAPDPDARAAVDAAVSALRRWAGLTGSGCLAPELGESEVRNRLTHAAARGDAASIERLADGDPQPQARLASAALLGSPRAQLRLALSELADQPATARQWLEASARRDADAQAYYGRCLIAGCFGVADPGAGRIALQSAARRGSPLALGSLTGAEHWPVGSGSGLPVLPGDEHAVYGTPAERYAYASLAVTLAREGCFGTAFSADTAAFTVLAELEHSLAPAELDAGRLAAAALAQDAGVPMRRAFGCD